MPIHYDSGPPTDWDGPVFLGDEAYGDVLKSKVINCTDFLPVFIEDSQVKVFLGLRDQEPMSDWWVFGGAQAIRRAPTESLSLRMRAEMGIEIDPSRFIFLDTASMPWPTREQEPKGAGCHMSSWFYAAELTPEEFGQIKVNEEYADTCLVDADDVLNGGYHPVLKHMVGKYLEHHDRQFQAIAWHNREVARVAARFTVETGLSARGIDEVIKLAGIPVLAELALEIIEQGRMRFTDRELAATLSAVIGEHPSTPAAQRYLREHDITPPPANLSPRDFYATLEAALEILL